MKTEELVEYVREMFDCDTPRKPDTLKALQFSMMDGADKPVDLDDLRLACELLVEEGMLEKAGDDTYRTTAQHEADKEENFRKSFAHAVANHVIKKAAGK